MLYVVDAGRYTEGQNLNELLLQLSQEAGWQQQAMLFMKAVMRQVCEVRIAELLAPTWQQAALSNTQLSLAPLIISDPLLSLNTVFAQTTLIQQHICFLVYFPARKPADRQPPHLLINLFPSPRLLPPNPPTHVLIP